MQQVSFITQDRVTIVGDFYAPTIQLEGEPRAVLLLHMMPVTKESFQEFAIKLQENGFYGLAIDLRGHGASVNQEGLILDYNTFSDENNQASMKDIKAAIEFLQKKNLKVHAIVGASIGANLALWYQSANSEIAKSVLLSAGFDYRGIKTRPLVLLLENSQGIYFAGGNQDVRSTSENAGQIAQILYDSVQVQNKKVDILETSTHGTDMFNFDPQLSDRIIGWLKA